MQCKHPPACLMRRHKKSEHNGTTDTKQRDKTVNHSHTQIATKTLQFMISRLDLEACKFGLAMGVCVGKLRSNALYALFCRVINTTALFALRGKWNVSVRWWCVALFIVPTPFRVVLRCPIPSPSLHPLLPSSCAPPLPVRVAHARA